MHPDILYQIALSHIPFVGPVSAKLLVSYCGGPREVFEKSRRDLLQIPGIGPKTADSVTQNEALQIAERELVYLEKNGIVPIFYLESGYPERLKQIDDFPTMLYFKGSDKGLFHSKRVLGIVGTRKPTPHGKAICEEMVEAMKSYNCLIVSGLAFGIDVAAHKSAVLHGIPNVGVLGHGLGRLYPDVHRPVAEKMCENGGLLTEYAFNAPPDREHFPMRNRIIAGLCDAVLVVETAVSGGSMITAKLAQGYDREVFAVPGRVKDPFSHGCHLLIKSNRASLAESADDIARQMGWDEKSASKKPRQAQLLLDLSEKEQNLVSKIREKPQIGIDDLTWLSGLSGGEVVATLLALEFKNVLRPLPGNRYELI